VPSYSEHPQEAADFALFLTALEQQRARAIAESFAPTYPELYHDAEVLAANPFFEELLRNALNQGLLSACSRHRGLDKLALGMDSA
jgi:trehalose/maltose transport system substrate-binding protein